MWEDAQSSIALCFFTTGYADGGGRAWCGRSFSFLSWSPFCVIFGLVAYTVGMSLPRVIQVAGVGIIAVGFLVAMGLYLSTRFQRSTPAVVTGLTLLGVLWGLLPIMAMVLESFRYQWPWVGSAMQSRHIVGAVVKVTPVGMIAALSNYSGRGAQSWSEAFSALIHDGTAYFVLYGGGTLFLLWRAKANIARHG